MTPRDPREAHRAATPLELLYDLCFVVAIAQAASSLHHAVAHGHTLHALAAFPVVFFTIWWAWMGFTWFASGFDNDDALYRLKVLVQMSGLLVLAAGVPRAFEHGDFGFITWGYAIMRLGLIAQWLRAARAAPEMRPAALRYAAGLALCQAGWISLLAAPGHLWIYGFAILAPLELLVPLWAECARRTPWHPEHIAERYGLMTIIVIGESVLAATLAIQTALDAEHPAAGLLTTILAAPVILFALWWIYFLARGASGGESGRRAFYWGYAHYFTFAAAAATGAGLAVQIDFATHEAHALTPATAGLALAVPVAIFLVSLAALQQRLLGICAALLAAAAALCILAPILLPAPWPPAAIALILATLTALLIHLKAREPTPA